jgi:hypothetical protein
MTFSLSGVTNDSGHSGGVGAPDLLLLRPKVTNSSSVETFHFDQNLMRPQNISAALL